MKKLENVFDVAVIGGGIIGLSVACDLAERGKKVILLEKNKIGMEASWSAAGTLEPVWDTSDDENLFQMKIESEKMWHDFAKKIQEETKVDVEYDSSGGILVAMNKEEMAILAKTCEIAASHGINSKVLSKEEIISMEPEINKNIFGGIFLSSECCVNPRKVTKALGKYFEKMGGKIRENSKVTGLMEKENRTVIGVKTSQEKIFARQTVNCAGSWSSEITGINVKPIKGYMVCFAAKCAPKIGHVLIDRNSVRVLRRKDGTLAAIGIMEDAGFDMELREESLKFIRAGAIRIVPRLKDCHVIEECSGFRPKGEDKFPVIGKISEGLYVATAHYKDGILLAPITAKIISESLEGKENGDVSPRRFMKN